MAADDEVPVATMPTMQAPYVSMSNPFRTVRYSYEYLSCSYFRAPHAVSSAPGLCTVSRCIPSGRIDDVPC